MTQDIKTVGIIGAGALGILFGYRINQALGRDNVFFIADAKRTERYRNEGHYVNGTFCDFQYVTPEDISEPVDLVIFAVKATVLEQALDEAAVLVGPDTLIISLLNGITSEQIIGERLGADHVLYVVGQGMDATRVDNRLTYAHEGTLSIGERDDSDTPRLHALIKLFNKAHISWNRPVPILRHQWSKLMLNTGINQVLAVKGGGYGTFHTDTEARDWVYRAMEEVKNVAKFEGITLTEEDIDGWFAILDELAAEGKPSLEQDIEAGRKTEVELFSGTIRKLGDKYGVDTPMNDFLYEKIIAMEAAS